MPKNTSLAALEQGECAVVETVGGETAMRCRLMDLGLIPGTKVMCLGKSPAGDPVAYLIRGTVIALRNKDASAVTGTVENIK
jgi:ferrous iron transport protein A